MDFNGSTDFTVAALVSAKVGKSSTHIDFGPMVAGLATAAHDNNTTGSWTVLLRDLRSVHILVASPNFRDSSLHFDASALTDATHQTIAKPRRRSERLGSKRSTSLNDGVSAIAGSDAYFAKIGAMA